MNTAILFITLFAFMAIGVPVAISLGLSSLLTILLFGQDSLASLSIKLYETSEHYTLLSIPFFILAGAMMSTGGVAKRMVRFAVAAVGHLRGGLAIASVLACTMFAAVSGSSPATVVAIGSIVIAGMVRSGYPQPFAAGVICNAGTLGILIPPSIVMVVYAAVTEESVGRMFMAGVVPGLVLAAMFMTYVAIYSKVSKKFDPLAEPPMSFAEKLNNSRFLIPVLSLIALVIGSMYLGLATATEAAAFGVLGSLGLAAGQGSLNRSTFFESLMGAVRTSAMIALILSGAAFLSLSMGFTGLPRGLADFIASLELSRFQLLMALLVFYIVLGCFLDGISSVVLTMAVVEPMIRQAGIDIIWFGIFIVVVVEMAQITPPIGFNLFVLQGMTRHEMNFIARAALPMFAIMVVMVFVLIAFPELATWLPDNMRQRPGG